MVTIRILMNQGIIKHAQNATTAYNEAQNNETEYLTYAEGEMDKYAGGKESALKAGEMKITYEVTHGSNQEEKYIFLYFELGPKEGETLKKPGWKFADEKLAGKSEQELETIFLESLSGERTLEEIREEMPEAAGQMDMSYVEYMKFWEKASMGGISTTMIQYIMYSLGYDNKSEEELAGIILEETGQEWEEYFTDTLGRTPEEFRESVSWTDKRMIQFLLAISHLGELMQYDYISVTGPEEVYMWDGGKVNSLSMLALAKVTQNGNYHFSAVGPNGETAEVTVPVTSFTGE